MVEMLKKLLKEYLEDDEIFSLTAKAVKKFHEALIKAGFTEKQATEIVAHQGSGIKAS